MPVRRAVEADLEALLALSVRMHNESNFRDIPLKETKLRQSLLHGVSGNDTLFLSVYDRNGKIIGYLFGLLQSPFFSDATVASDLMFYVDPTHRGSPAAFRLWRSFRDWAQAKGACEIRQGITTGISPERTDRFFRKLGMEPTGQNYRVGIIPSP